MRDAQYHHQESFWFEFQTSSQQRYFSCEKPLFKGFWFPSWLFNSVLACQKHFQAHNSDIILVTSPKSGTTWLKAILFALLNRAKYSNPNSEQCHPLLTRNPLVPYLEFQLYLQQEDPNYATFASPRLLATHLPYSSLPQLVRDSKCKLVYLCRDPKDNFISLWHFTKKIMLKENGLSMYGPYWDHVLGYHKMSLEMPEKVFFMKYEEMKEDPCVHVRRLADFVGCPFSEEELRGGTVEGILRMCSFDNLSTLEVNKSGSRWTGVENKSFFRRGEVGDWANYMSAEMGERIDGVMEEKLHDSGLKF
ncbi:hypothetical protein EUGRSUZ_C01964 [Eucalyptus grandis]|uniref:Uncharacterized protein n=2 Tax=Eucalyptus grandis TaxID=71139 RepID=A0ACC3LEJ9_EUCGR|nr:hypothetical protein EUGRSUZ_C01964 [Eucalyptus grandis]